MDALQGLKGEPHFLDGNAMQESREEALAGDVARRDAATARVVNCWTRKQIFWFFAIILTEPRVERSKKKKRLYAWERVKTQNSIHP